MKYIVALVYLLSLVACTSISPSTPTEDTTQTTVWVGVTVALITGGLGLIGGIVGTFFGFQASTKVAFIELDKTRPEATMHMCRVAENEGMVDFHVYTYATGRRDIIGPSCVYLDKDDFATCLFEPQNESSQKMKAHNKGLCYLAYFSDNTKLINKTK